MFFVAYPGLDLVVFSVMREFVYLLLSYNGIDQSTVCSDGVKNRYSRKSKQNSGSAYPSMYVSETSKNAKQRKS